MVRQSGASPRAVVLAVACLLAGGAAGGGCSGDDEVPVDTPDGRSDGDDGCCDEPSRVVCEACLDDTECGEERLCGLLSSTEAVCLEPCPLEGDCDEGFACVALGVRSLCVPDRGTCEPEPCGDRVCDDSEVCAPLDPPVCLPRVGTCEDCVDHEQCGPTGRCVRLVAAADPACLETCSASRPCASGRCAFPDGPFQDGICVPSLGVCEDLCADVTCVGEAAACNPLTGTCVVADVPFCGGPCETDFECVGPSARCVEAGGGSFCSVACGPTAPCGSGYFCVDGGDGDGVCVPDTDSLRCDACVGVVCGSGERCDATSGLCVALPAPCGVGAACPAQAVCATNLWTCVAAGAACEVTTAASTCAADDQVCTAIEPGVGGTCEPACPSSVVDCPASYPACERLHGLASGVCTSGDLPGAQRCGRLMPGTQALGRPCGWPGDAGCGATAPLCHDSGSPVAGSFCTRACASDDECPEPGASCLEAPSDPGLRVCVPAACDCAFAGDYAGLGSPFHTLGQLAGVDLCALHETIESARTSPLLVPYTHAFRRPDAGIALHAPLDAWREQARTAQRWATAYADRAPLELAELLVREALATRERSAALPPLIDEEPGLDVRQELAAWLLSVGPDPLSEAGFAAAAVLPNELAPLLAQLRRFDQQYENFVQTFGTGTSAGDWASLLESFLNDDVLTNLQPTQRFVFGRLFEMRLLAAEWIRFHRSVAEVPWDSFSGLPDFYLEFETRRGLVIFSGTGDDVHDTTDPVLFAVDFGGDDVWRGGFGGAVGPLYRLSVVIDASGADLWTYHQVGDPRDGELLPADFAGREPVGPPRSRSNRPRQGGAIMGVGAVWDLGEGDDTFESLRLSQGFGLGGIGVLVDESGGGTFRMEGLGQGAGLFGVGLLVTGDRPSSFEVRYRGQGWGGPGGVGILSAGHGPDGYDAPGSPDLTNPWSVVGGVIQQVQGAGGGVGAGGLVTSGGLGVLLERGGDDTYRAARGGQGFGIAHGVGLLIDVAGDDEYTGGDWTQGAAARHGSGAVWDGAGDDTWSPISPASSSRAGAATAGGTALLFDAAGDDSYVLGSRSGAASASAGRAALLDADGNDQYTLLPGATLTLGACEAPEEHVMQIAVFADLAGADVFTSTPPEVGNNATWLQPGASAPRLLCGGLDASLPGWWPAWLR